MLLVTIVQFIHFILLLFIVFGAILLHTSKLIGYLLFLVATWIHWVLLNDKCILTIWEEKLTKDPNLEPFNKRLIESLGISVSESKLKKIEKGIMIGIIVIACSRIFLGTSK
jgi:hypothetical protein